MTELQWLIQMLTKQKLSSSLKDLFIERIGEVEANLVPKAHVRMPSQTSSTQRLIEEQAYPSEIAQTPAAAAALEARQTAIKIASSGKPEPGRTSPRKF
jgi:hypothetical protein